MSHRRPFRLLASLAMALSLLAGSAAQAERGTAPAQTPPAAQPVAPRPVPDIADVPGMPAPPVPLLWKVTGEAGALYLLGSFHFLKPEDYPLAEEVEQVVASVDEVVFELAPEELESPTLAMQMMQAGLRSDGSRLDDDLPPAMAARLADWGRRNLATLRTSGMEPQGLQLFEPWFASLLVTTTELARYGLEARLGLDVHLARRARAAGLSTSGLETAMQQIRVLDGMDLRWQVEMLGEALDQADAGPDAIDALHATWRAGDAARLWDEMAADMRERAPALYQRINTDRNDAWLPRLDAMLRQESDILVVVGALHLLGEDGVVEKLAARGYAVERICVACPAMVPAAGISSMP
ncbi:TraB/GumN family protein [Luteimonas deserti]|uniref:TraB/GumN family protein n=1 Tax=Luteimonas deserti TaxID=2752306 RepID=A0A7Z0TVF8_9GAMM|nr:TraB/GumN family protein [Luteimonas deserti]NYZ63816.1 TraB/GumN family protein [Luteimonas deserti]